MRSEKRDEESLLLSLKINLNSIIFSEVIYLFVFNDFTEEICYNSHNASSIQRWDKHRLGVLMTIFALSFPLLKVMIQSLNASLFFFDLLVIYILVVNWRHSLKDCYLVLSSMCPTVSVNLKSFYWGHRRSARSEHCTSSLGHP